MDHQIVFDTKSIYKEDNTSIIFYVFYLFFYMVLKDIIKIIKLVDYEGYLYNFNLA